MSEDLGTSIILTMAPIFVLMIGLIGYGIYKNKSRSKGQSKHETDALIEAQAMLAKYKKEQAKKEATGPEEKKDEKHNEPKETDTKADSKKDESKTEEKSQKPNAEAPISDTTELEPDIDKTENE